MAEGGIAPVLNEQESVSANQSEQNQTETKMDILDQVLERARSERMNELRQIQNDNRPVTGQDNRQNIHQFMAKNLEIRENVIATGKENVPLNTANVEEHRPETVVVEIQGVAQQHRVSSMLQTAGFRRNLENIIRGSIRSVSHTLAPSRQSTQSFAGSRQSPVTARQPQSSVDTHQATQSPMNTRSQTPVGEVLSSAGRQGVAVSGLTASERRDSLSGRSAASTSSSSTGSVPVATQHTRIHDPRGLLGSIVNNGERVPPTIPSDIAPDVNWHTVEELQQEDLIHEVSELVHRRLVTSTLEGEFRNVLELQVRQHLDNTGSDGERVQQYIRSIPRTDIHIPNDFSNLGIPPPVENWDNISVTSYSATAHIPYNQSNLHLSREVASLKAQLQEMRNMMKVSFDLQLDIQRSIRQEVAAGIAAANTGTQQGAPVTTAPVRSKPVNDTHCLICLDNYSDSLLYQCGHMCTCYPCGRRLMDTGAKCPVCRAPIRDIIRAYRCNQD